MGLRLVETAEVTTESSEGPVDPRDPALYRTGISSARAALRDGVARRHERERLLADEVDGAANDDAQADVLGDGTVPDA